MHEMQTIVTDVRSVCLSRGSTRLHRAGVIQCSLCQITLASCFFPLIVTDYLLICARESLTCLLCSAQSSVCLSLAAVSASIILGRLHNGSDKRGMLEGLVAPFDRVHFVDNWQTSTRRLIYGRRCQWPSTTLLRHLPRRRFVV